MDGEQARIFSPEATIVAPPTIKDGQLKSLTNEIIIPHNQLGVAALHGGFAMENAGNIIYTEGFSIAMLKWGWCSLSCELIVTMW